MKFLKGKTEIILQRSPCSSSRLSTEDRRCKEVEVQHYPFIWSYYVIYQMKSHCSSSESSGLRIQRWEIKLVIESISLVNMLKDNANTHKVAYKTMWLKKMVLCLEMLFFMISYISVVKDITKTGRFRMILFPR